MENRKKSAVVLRRNVHEHAHVVRWLEFSGYQTTDIYDWRKVQIFELNNAGADRLFLDERPTDSFDLIYYLGTPGAYYAAPWSRDHWYRAAERTAALLAALTGISTSHLVNRGQALLWGRQLTDPLTLLRRLAGCGWRTPAIDIEFDFTSISTAGPKPYWMKHSWLPRPEENKDLVVFTLSAPPCLTSQPYEIAPDDLLALAEPMRALLGDLGWDWATIATARCQGTLNAYGMSPNLPRSLPDEVAACLFQSLSCPPTADAPSRLPRSTLEPAL